MSEPAVEVLPAVEQKPSPTQRARQFLKDHTVTATILVGGLVGRGAGWSSIFLGLRAIENVAHLDIGAALPHAAAAVGAYRIGELAYKRELAYKSSKVRGRESPKQRL